jgi:hypothetical protein
LNYAEFSYAELNYAEFSYAELSDEEFSYAKCHHSESRDAKCCGTLELFYYLISNGEGKIGPSTKCMGAPSSSSHGLWLHPFRHMHYPH